MILQFFKKNQPAKNETKAAAMTTMMAFCNAGRVVWAPRDTNNLTRTGFISNPIGFRCIKMVAEAVGAIPLILQDHERKFNIHPILDLLKRPNAAQGKADLMEALITQLLLSGNAYLEGVWHTMSDNEIVPKELYVLRSDRMQVVPGHNGWPVAYHYTVGNKKHRFKINQSADPILHIKSFHPNNDHYGLSPMQAAANAVDIYQSACKWSKSLLDNAARPSGAIVYKGMHGNSTLATEQYQRLLNQIESNHTGAINAGRPMLLEGGLDWKQIGFSPADMEFHKTKEAAAREVALAFGVPPMLLGLPGDNTYANYAESNRAFYRLTVLPLISKVVDSISNWLCHLDNKTMVLKPDLDSIPALSEERKAHWKRVSAANFLTAAEKRMMLGLPKMTIE